MTAATLEPSMTVLPPAPGDELVHWACVECGATYCGSPDRSGWTKSDPNCVVCCELGDAMAAGRLPSVCEQCGASL